MGGCTRRGSVGGRVGRPRACFRERSENGGAATGAQVSGYSAGTQTCRARIGVRRATTCASTRLAGWLGGREMCSCGVAGGIYGRPDMVSIVLLVFVRRERAGPSSACSPTYSLTCVRNARSMAVSARWALAQCARGRCTCHAARRRARPPVHSPAESAPLIGHLCTPSTHRVP